MNISKKHKIPLLKVVCILVVLIIVFCIGAKVANVNPSDIVDLGKSVIGAKVNKKSLQDRMDEIIAKKPHLRELADSANGELRILVLKKERKLEVHSKGWSKLLTFDMTGFSGKLGPKLREGDGQIPEGIYGVEYLNPNSRFHLSLKVSYPNQFDRLKADGDRRDKLGGDIMIHGGSATIGCVPIGNDAIEDLFYIVAVVGIKNVSVVMAPYDMRAGRNFELEKSDIPWYPELCDQIEKALAD